jgi:hypothetical protein
MPSPPEPAAGPVERRARRAAAFGLRLEVDSRIELPGPPPGVALGAGAADEPGAEPRTRVWLDPEGLERRWSSAGEPPRRMRELGAGEDAVLTVDLAEPAGYLLDAKEVGRVLVSLDGAEVLCDPLPGHPDWAFILPAQALPLAATLRGLEVFHAAGVVVEGGAALFAGTPGAGKSSLAAAFVRRGAALLGDDAIALERRQGSLLAHPGAGALYLRAAEHERLSTAERGALGPAQPFASRQRYAPGAVAAAVPFSALFLLERAESGLAIEPLASPDPFELLASTFNLSVRTPERLTRQLDMVEALVASGGVYRLRVLPGVDATRLAEAVERHLLAARR